MPNPISIARARQNVRMAAERIDVSTAREMARAGDLIIDVRSADEYAGGHIAGAINVPIDTLPKAAESLPDALKLGIRVRAVGRTEEGTGYWFYFSPSRSKVYVYWYSS